jgi:phosphatidate cytidylyltransferase
MDLRLDHDVAGLVSGVAGLLVIATAVGRALGTYAVTDRQRVTFANLNARVASWWVMCGVVLGALLLGPIGGVLLFALLSFGALREFVILAPTRRADHRVLLLAFFVTIPVQYGLIAARWHGLFAILIPVYGVLFLAAAAAAAGDTNRFTERMATIQCGVILYVYGVSHVPALLMLEIPGYDGENAKLLVYLILIVEASDVLQYIWGKLCGRHPIAPRVSPSKTIEGFVGGVASATLLGCALWRLTPFDPWHAALLSFVAAVMGFAGGLVMSAIKRDRGVKDFGSAIPGHGGILDRIDSLCFAGPVFFHLTRYFFAVSD